MPAWVGLVALLACGGTQQAAAPEAPAPGSGPEAKPAAPASKPAEVPTEVDIQAFHAAYEAGEVPLLVDVRTPEEWEAGHVPGAVHIPMREIQGRLAELEPHKSDPIYVICASGGRSSRVSEMLRSQGFKAVNVAGGTNGWKAAGYPVE